MATRQQSDSDDENESGIFDAFKDTPLQDVAAGTKLVGRQAKFYEKWIKEVMEAIESRRHLLLTHNSLQNTIGLFLQSFGFDVSYEVPFLVGGFGGERSVFDIVSQFKKNTTVVEIKDVVDDRAIGQILSYVSALKLQKTKADVFLGTDFLNWFRLVDGTLGEAVQDLMESKKVGVILADKYLFGMFDNWTQLCGDEMAAIWLSTDPIG